MKTFVWTFFIVFLSFIIYTHESTVSKFKCGVGFDEGLHSCVPYYKCENGGKEWEIRNENGVCDKSTDVCCKKQDEGNSKESNNGGTNSNKPKCNCIPYYKCKDTKPSFDGCVNDQDVCCKQPDDDNNSSNNNSKEKCIRSDGTVHSCMPYYKCKDKKPEYSTCQSETDVCCKKPDTSN